MGNKSAKLEINVDGEEPFKPGEKISGEAVLTTTKPLKLKNVFGMEIKFEGRSWNNEPDGSDESIEHANESISLPMPVSGGKHLQPGMHRFAFSFEIPENSNSSIVFSRYGETNFNVTAIFQGRNEAALATAKRDLSILAPPKLSASGAINEVNEPFSAEATIWKNNPDHKPQLREQKMKLQLPKRIFKPGELIPISGKFVNDTQWPFKIKAAIIGGFVGAEPKTIEDWYADDTPVIGEAEHPITVQPFQVIVWNSEEFFRLPATIPTESSLFEPFRNRRRLLIWMEWADEWRYPNPTIKPWYVKLAFPILIED